jgi:glycerophosphoryl diester phosphodiesterase
MKPKVIAHRGARRLAPENTLEAFKLSLDAHSDGIEFDVHRCASGEIVVIHDHTLSRTTTGSGYVKDASLKEIQGLDAGSWFDSKFAGVKVPTLEQVLDLVSGSVTLNIEIKNAPVEYPGIESDVLRLLEGYPKETIIVSSFDHNVLKRFWELDKTISLAVLADAIFFDIGAYAEQFGAKFWHPGFSELRSDAVDAAHRAGLKVNTWTVNGETAWMEALKFNVDGIVTDDPHGLIRYLSQPTVEDSLNKFRQPIPRQFADV